MSSSAKDQQTQQMQLSFGYPNTRPRVVSDYSTVERRELNQLPTLARASCPTATRRQKQQANHTIVNSIAPSTKDADILIADTLEIITSAELDTRIDQILPVQEARAKKERELSSWVYNYFTSKPCNRTWSYKDIPTDVKKDIQQRYVKCQ
jgi:hypothetical protein